MRVTGVLLEDGAVPCDVLVLSMGPWAKPAQPWLGCAISKGILLSTGMGAAIADLITTGQTPLSIAAASPARFSENAT